MVSAHIRGGERDTGYQEGVLSRRGHSADRLAASRLFGLGLPGPGSWFRRGVNHVIAVLLVLLGFATSLVYFGRHATTGRKGELDGH